MQPNSTFLDALTRIREGFHRHLGDLTPEELVREPAPPVGWLCWRTARIWDSNFSRLCGLEQLWIADGWHVRFSMEPNPTDFGRGASHTREQVAAFRPDSAQLLLDYLDVVYQRAETYVNSLDAGEFDRELNEPQYTPLPTIAVRIVSLIENGFQNLGQVAYLKLLHRIGGWFPAEVRG